VVNNVETFCCAARILQEGAGWFSQFGSHASPGTKLLSISGDCLAPGVYELPFGITLQDVLGEAGAQDPIAVQIGGAAGLMVGREGFQRCICYDDLATGGSIIVLGKDRDPLEVAAQFMRFFVHESCGYCTPCRVGTVLVAQRLEDIRAGKGQASDLEYLRLLGETMKLASRCGLGQTAANPVLSTMAAFPQLYEQRLVDAAGLQPRFDIHAALETASQIAGRESTTYGRSGDHA
jgi:[NiFe] hydrogenase diaphorase moiety large subunit